ncbi:unnamed protein product [Leuciscus chuanchicus]
MSDNSECIPVGTSPGQTRYPVGGSGLASYGAARSPRSPRARDCGGGSGSIGYRTQDMAIRLRDCSVVLNHPPVGRVGDGTLGETDAGQTHLAWTSSVEDSLVTVQAAASPGGDPVQVTPSTSRALDGGTGDFTYVLCGVSVKRHFSTQHGKALVRYRCRSCGKTSDSAHPIACHVPKCRGQKVTAPAGVGFLAEEGPAKQLRSHTARDSEVLCTSVPPIQPNLPEDGLLMLLRVEARKMAGEGEGDDRSTLTCLRPGWMAATNYPNWSKRKRKGYSRDASLEGRVVQPKGRKRNQVGPGPGTGGGAKRKLSPESAHTTPASTDSSMTRPASLQKYSMEGLKGDVQYLLKLYSTPSRPNGGPSPLPRTGPVQAQDGIGKLDILNWDPRCETLTRLFNMWWFTGVVPTRLKKSRTVLIPKTSDPGATVVLLNQFALPWLYYQADLSEVKEGVLRAADGLRLFTRVVTKRLTETCPIHLDRGGFVLPPGVRRTSRCCEASSDTAKKSAAHSRTTSVKVGGRNTPNIEVRVGVKQGDPLSPLLFNLAMDPLIHGLKRYGTVNIVEDGHSVVCLAFADDLVVVGGSWSDMAHNLGLLDSFCQSTGLKVQPTKCRSFLVKPGSGAFSVNDCAPWVLGGRALQRTTIVETIKYLGVKINPWAGAVGLDLFALPWLYYQADLSEVKEGVLRAADGKIKWAFKKWLHLPPSTCDGLLYAKNRDGGLGICKLARHIPSIQARRLVRLACSSEPVMRALTETSFMQSKLKGAWMRAGGTEANLPLISGEDLNDRGDANDLLTHKCVSPFDWRQDEFLKWMGLPVQGVGISCFRGSSASNAWLRKPACLSETVHSGSSAACRSVPHPGISV